MKRLYEIGFQHVGHWRLDSGRLVLELDGLSEHRNVLYAFATKSEVKYVGKTTSSLRRRMLGYLRPSESQRTNHRNHHALIKLLGQDSEVNILALADQGLHQFGAFHLNYAAGLEDSIINVLRPEWNGAKTSSRIETDEEANPSEASREAVLEQNFRDNAVVFTVELGQTYFSQGFFNVPAEFKGLFASNGSEIQIYCGESKETIKGLINRTVNTTSGTPRIYGRHPLAEWFQDNHSLNDLFRVRVLGPAIIELW